MSNYKINFFVTSLCNAKMLTPVDGAPGVCDFCFRPPKTIYTSRDIINTIVDSLDKIFICEPLILTGGEPLVSDHLSYFINALSKKGHRISLHTNGLLLREKASILQSIDSISLPYDGHTPELADYYRGFGYYEIEQDAFSLVDQYEVSIGLHTLLTPRNIAMLGEMADSLCSKKYYRKIWYWYIKRFKKINLSLQMDTSQYELEEDVYREAIAEIKDRYPSLPIISSGQVSQQITTLFIALNGNVYVYRNGQRENELLGNLLLEDITAIVPRI